jgi:hypothetical protein
MRRATAVRLGGAHELVGIETEEFRELARGARGSGHLARRGGHGHGNEIAREHTLTAIEQIPAHRLQQHALFLIQVGAFGVTRMLDDLQPADAQPHREQPQRQAGRSHQHPTLAHFPVGQLLPSVERRFTQTAGPSQARCGGAAGTH